MVCMPYFLADGGGLLSLPLVNGFYEGLRAVLPRGYKLIPLTSGCQWLSPWNACRIAQWMAADCLFFHLSMSFMTVCMPYFSEDGGGLLILLLVNGFHDGLHAVLRSGY